MVTATTDTTTPTRTPPRNNRSRRGPLTAVLGAGAALLLGAALLAFGGVHPTTRTVLHVACAALLLCAAALPEATLARAGVLWRIAAAGACVLGALVVGLPWSLVPERSILLAAEMLLPIATALVVAAWGASRWRRRECEGAVLGFGAVVALLAILHAASGTTSLLGIVDTWIERPARFFAPFLNPNHLAAALLLPLPVAIGVALRAGVQPSLRIASALLAVLTLGAIVWTRSIGGLAAAGVVVVAAWVVAGRLKAWALAALAPAGIALLVVADRWASAHDALTLHGRWEMWRASFALWRDHLISGAGGGTFVLAVLPYRSDRQFVSWDHAHNDWIEWIAETGIVGLVGLVVALVLLRPRPTRTRARAALLLLGVGGVALHALVDFPLHIPGIAMAAAAVWAMVLAVYEERQPAAPRPMRAMLVAVATLSIVAAGATVWTDRIDRAAALVMQGGPSAPQAARTLERLAPWRPELAVHQVRRVESSPSEGVPAAASAARRFAWEPDALRELSASLVRMHDGPAALDVAQAAVDRSPSDWRNWVSRAAAMEVAHPDEAGQAWVDAVAAGAPAIFVRRGWRWMPVGLVWADAVAGLPYFAINHVANELAKLGDAEAALIAYEQARLQAPHVLHVGHARLLLKMGMVDEAAGLLEDALSRGHDPRHVELLAEAREAQGRTTEAVALWLELAPRNPRMLVRAARAKATSDGAEAALAWLDAVALTGGVLSTDGATQLERARLQMQAGRPEQCIRSVVGSGMLDDPKYGKAAAALFAECRSPSAGEPDPGGIPAPPLPEPPPDLEGEAGQPVEE
jgi:tetratricopeptide (TPR) repeat protein